MLSEFTGTAPHLLHVLKKDKKKKKSTVHWCRQWYSITFTPCSEEGEKSTAYIHNPLQKYGSGERERRKKVSQNLNFTPTICAESLKFYVVTTLSLGVMLPEEHPKTKHNTVYHPLDTDTET